MQGEGGLIVHASACLPRFPTRLQPSAALLHLTAGDGGLPREGGMKRLSKLLTVNRPPTDYWYELADD